MTPGATSPVTSPADRALTLFLIVLAVAAGFVTFRGGAFADLLAAYLAGQAAMAGQTGAIYPPPAEMFDLSVPPAWPAMAEALGLGRTTLYPFIYPPLWAWFAGLVTTFATPQQVFLTARIVHPLLLALAPVLTWRILRPPVRLPVWTAAGILVLFATLFGFIALHQAQPQIVVSLLILLAIERHRAGRPVLAGALLALATSVKLYPLLLTVIWLARGERRALGGFAATGLALGLASLAIGGIALHVEFLRTLAAINRTVILTQLTTNFDALMGQLLFADSFAPNAPGPGGATGLHALRPLWPGLVSKALLLASLALIWRLARRATPDAVYARLWPALLILVSLFSPLSWSYHYITAAAFIPWLLFCRSPWQGPVPTLLFLALFSVPGVAFLSALPSPVMLVQALGTLGLALLAVMFLRPAPAMPQCGDPAPQGRKTA